MKLIQIIVPLIAIVLILSKLPDSIKRGIFMLPIWLTSTALSMIFGHLFLAGVYAGPGTLVLDIFLFPCMLWMNWKLIHRTRREREPVELTREGDRFNLETGKLVRAQPAEAM